MELAEANLTQVHDSRLNRIAIYDTICIVVDTTIKNTDYALSII